VLKLYYKLWYLSRWIHTHIQYFSFNKYGFVDFQNQINKHKIKDRHKLWMFQIYFFAITQYLTKTCKFCKSNDFHRNWSSLNISTQCNASCLAQPHPQTKTQKNLSPTKHNSKTHHLCCWWAQQLCLANDAT
jgi:RNA polymerase subunit RPABC4/transcription elongation factor Spt4